MGSRADRLGPVLAGLVLRSYGALTSTDAPLVAVVSEAMAGRYWPDQNAIGKRIGYEPSDDSVLWMTVVGVAPGPVIDSLDAEPYPHVYVPQVQVQPQVQSQSQSQVHAQAQSAVGRRARLGTPLDECGGACGHRRLVRSGERQPRRRWSSRLPQPGKKMSAS